VPNAGMCYGGIWSRLPSTGLLGQVPAGRCVNEIHRKLPQALPRWKNVEDLGTLIN
jgi:hypothetical protein